MLRQLQSALEHMLMSAHMARSSSHLAFFDLESIGIALSKQLHDTRVEVLDDLRDEPLSRSNAFAFQKLLLSRFPCHFAEHSVLAYVMPHYALPWLSFGR